VQRAGAQSRGAEAVVMMIRVKNEHIQESCRRDARRCMVARAMSDSLGRPVTVWYALELGLTDDPSSDYLVFCAGDAVVRLPRSVYQCVLRYDMTDYVPRPFRFRLTRRPP